MISECFRGGSYICSINHGTEGPKCGRNAVKYVGMLRDTVIWHVCVCVQVY